MKPKDEPPPTLEEGQEVVERLGIDVGKWATEVRARVAVALSAPDAREPRPDAVERVLHLMHQCETCTGYGDPETIRIFRGVALRIREAVYGSSDEPPVVPPCTGEGSHHTSR